MGVKSNIAIAGAGGVGSATGLLLREIGDFDVDIYIGDGDPDKANKTAEWIREGSSKKGIVEAFTMPWKGTNESFDAILKEADIVLDCLPGSEAPRIASLAKKHDLHYANLTEHVKETEKIKKIAEDAERGFILQTGLAPGFINVLANGLFKQFCEIYEVDKVNYVSMKVGALTQCAFPPHYYGFTWSPIGVATEYLEPAIVIRDYKKTKLPSLSERKTVVINGVTYEEALTSGGAADLPDVLEGKVKNLDYKTLRYPGHYSWIENLLKDIDELYRTGIPYYEGSRADKLQKKMEEFVPTTRDDVISNDIVVIYSSVQGKDKKGTLRIIEEWYEIRPTWIGNKYLRAIQSTTAAALAESARMLLSERYRGAITQSMIDPKEFMNGPFVSYIYKTR